MEGRIAELAQLGQRSGVEITGLEQVPHDLWAAADLPPISLVARLTLIAVQFDLTFKVAGEPQAETAPTGNASCRIARIF